MKRASRRTPPHTSPPRSRNKPSSSNAPNSLLAWCSHHQTLCLATLTAIWVLVLYSKAIGAPFLYDDLDQIVNNPSLRSWHAVFTRFFLAPVSFTTDLLGEGGSTYRPLYWLTMALDRRIWGINEAGGFHFMNLVIHWANGVLLFQLWRRIGLSSIAAATAAVVWLGLPVNTEAVAWVSGRAYLLCTFFLLSALLTASSYVRKESRAALTGYAALSLAALFCHEQGLLLLPLTVLLLLATRPPAPRAAWTKLAGIALATDLIAYAVKYKLGVHAGDGPSALWSVGSVFWIYLRWMLAPVHMSVERSTSLPANTASVAAIAAWIAAIALLSAAALFFRKLPVTASSLLFGCIALLPFCGFVHVYQGMAERFLYLASIGFTVAIVSLAFASPEPWKKAAVCGLIAWISWGAWRLTSRVLDWNDSVSLYRSSLQATPASPTLFFNLGNSLRDRGDLNGALEAYQQTIHRRPTYERAYAGIGDVYERLGKPADAINAYSQALDLQPQDAATITDLAVALQQTGDNLHAEQRFKQAIALAPQNSVAYVDLGGLYEQQGRTDEAIQCFQKAIAIAPNDPNPYFDMAVLFQKMGHDEQALTFYRKVLALKPDDPDTLLYMSKLHTPSTTR
jgi:protein O-mannosyl-transferase